MHTLTIIFSLAALIMLEVYYLHRKRLKELKTASLSTSKSNRKAERDYVARTPKHRTSKEVKFCELLERTSEVEWPSRLTLDDEPSLLNYNENNAKVKFDKVKQTKIASIKDMEYHRLMRLIN